MLRVLTLATLFPDATRPNFGIFVERQTCGLAAHPGVEVQVVAPIGVPAWPFSTLERFRAFADVPQCEEWRGLSVHRPRFLTVPGTGGRFHVGALVHRLRPLLAGIRRRFPFDVIDAEFFFPDGPAAVALGAEMGVPVSIKARGADIHSWGHARGVGVQVRRAGQRADGLLAVSGAMREDMAAVGIPRERIRVHHTGVDQDIFVPQDRAAARRAWGVSGPLVVSVGALIARKGHQVVIEAVARLPGVSLLIAGQGEERAALEALIARLGVGDRVRLLGPVRHGDLPALFAAADVMALASASEGLANAWVEALACGTPIVITDAGGAREVLTDPAYGRIAERSADGFARGIADRLANLSSQEAVRRGAARFTWAANTAALVAHLSALVEAKRSACAN